LQYYFDILQSDSEYPLKIAAIRQISNNASTPGAYTLEQLKMISAWLLDDENSNKIKYHLIMLSGDYYSLFPEETLEVFRTIYWAAGSSNLSRALAADFLNRLEPDGGPDGANWEIVEVSPEEWADYYSD